MMGWIENRPNKFLNQWPSRPLPPNIKHDVLELWTSVVAPDHDSDHDDALSRDGRRGRGGPILSVALAWLPRVVATGCRRRDVTDDSDDEDDDEEGGGGGWIILAGCAGGIVREWPAFDLSNSSSGREDEKNDASVVTLGRFDRSDDGGRRLPRDPVPFVVRGVVAAAAAVVYGLMDGWMVRFVVPPFFARSSTTGSGGVSRGTTVPLVATRLAFAGGEEDAAGGRQLSRHRGVLRRSAGEATTISIITLRRPEDYRKIRDENRRRRRNGVGGGEGVGAITTGHVVLICLAKTGKDDESIVEYKGKPLPGQVCFQLPSYDVGGNGSSPTEDDWRKGLEIALLSQSTTTDSDAVGTMMVRVEDKEEEGSRGCAASSFRSSTRGGVEGGSSSLTTTTGGMPYEGFLFYRPPLFVHRSKLASISCGRGSGGSRYVDVIARLADDDDDHDHDDVASSAATAGKKKKGETKPSSGGGTTTLEFTNVHREEWERSRLRPAPLACSPRTVQDRLLNDDYYYYDGGARRRGRDDNDCLPPDAFVAICAPRSIVVYRDRRDDDSDYEDASSSRTRLVRFDESTTGGGPLTCAAISPGTMDLALGRERGHVGFGHRHARASRRRPARQYEGEPSVSVAGTTRPAKIRPRVVPTHDDDDDDDGGGRGGCVATTAWSTTRRSDKEGVGLQSTAPPRQRAAFLGRSIVRGKKSITPTINKL
ncbi:hypothetical protein ACHAW5_008802 [Stephanodiscus triporus]|uniref:Anaphase-promoting complex subunit 1 n=1 Tax=Stephanodiscus triporus TaxID=2934178 RepID=A0ABD3P7X6_9STRA